MLLIRLCLFVASSVTMFHDVNYVIIIIIISIIIIMFSCFCDCVEPGTFLVDGNSGLEIKGQRECCSELAQQAHRTLDGIIFGVAC